MEEAKALSPDGKADVPHLETEEDIDAVNRQSKTLSTHTTSDVTDLGL
jgi:hypothetical protein